MIKTFRIGTRGSPLALIQAEEVKRRLLVACPELKSGAEIEIIPISTSGDWSPGNRDVRFVDEGGNKGFFTKEIEEALLSGSIDMAVHSVKDLASTIPEGIRLAAVLERENPQDAFICKTVDTIEGLPKGAVLGTSSLRRQAQVLALRPDLKVVPLRGNVETRLHKMEEGLVDATILAYAGLKRLNMERAIASVLPVKMILPAAAQGALGVEVREDAQDLLELLKNINDEMSMRRILAERAVMRAIDGSCHTPAGALAEITSSGRIAIEAMVSRPDGTGLVRLAATGDVSNAEQVGDLLGQSLRRRAPDGALPSLK